MFCPNEAMEFQENSQKRLYQSNNVTVTNPQLQSFSHKGEKNVPTSIVGTFLRSSIFQGVILGWIGSISSLVLLVYAFMYSQKMDVNFVWNLRIGLFLSAVTVFTRIMSIIVGFMLPAILAGIFAFIQTPILESGATISKLMEASMTRGLWSTVMTCFSFGKTFKFAIVIALVLAWQYMLSAADLYIHTVATGTIQRLPGEIVTSARGINIATNCTETLPLFDTCGQWQSATNGGLLNPARALKTYQNTSETLQVLYADGGVYLLQSPPPVQVYAYSGSGIFLQPSCKPISKICKLEGIAGAFTNYTCPETLWSAAGNTQKHGVDDVFLNITTLIYDQVLEKFKTFNPIQAIVSARIARGGLTNYDSEFINETHGDLSILMHCQIFASLIEYVVTLGSLKASPLGNLTNPQLVALVGASARMARRAVNDVADLAYKGDSKSFANGFALQWAQATIASFSGAVQENGEGYSYTLDINKEQTVVPISAALLYVIIIAFPPLIFSCICLNSLRNWLNGICISWIFAEYICNPQRLFYQSLIGEHYIEDSCLKSLAVQEKILRNVELSITIEDGHIVQNIQAC
ncbi:7406_t:CDS:1 [Funneliformis caledonium]|uniref:7406_t:CDS:1 n=1 Tax=Funneliformis caledonium TaxID=1117310 RepID=A0A9N9GGZ9_9GLOM|nr:7406_t:CDS:1 [Funneliformis caledonium]